MQSKRNWIKSLAFLPFIVGACSQTERESLVDGPDREGPAKAALTSDPAQQSVAGCWRMVQGSYKGVLTLRQEGTVVKGFMDWENHQDAIATGSIQGTTLSLDFDYFTPPKHNLSGLYVARLAADGKSFQSLTAVAFTGTSQACIDISGCWYVRKGQDSGTVSLFLRSNALSGYVDWDSRENNAVVAGTVSNGRLTMTVTQLDLNPLNPPLPYPETYTAGISTDKLYLVDGQAWDNRYPATQTAWNGISKPCKDISGCFRVEQRNTGGPIYTGLWQLTQGSGVFDVSPVTGSADWSNHEDGIFEGNLTSRKLSLVHTFPGTPKEGVVGYYNVVVDPAGDAFSGSTSGPSGVIATYSGLRALCPAP